MKMLVLYRSFLAVLTTVFLLIETAEAQSLTPYAYDIGSPSVVDYYIDPVTGSDSNSGLSASAAWRTVQHGWGIIPQSATLSQGFRFNLMNGDYGSDELPNYWELRNGSATHPIIIQAASGQTAVRFVRDINMANVSYFYLININITPTPAGDAFHCERCDHLLIRGCVLNGGGTADGAHETLKVNQSQYVYIENNNISNADDNNIDFVGVQYGHIIGNRIHDALDWCAYVKGGSAYIRIESNELFNCGTGGITVGQGSGFQFMTSPWIHYEAYDVKVINNIVHDVEGAAFGVNGGYNALIAHNTAYRVGSRSHLLEVVFGERTCDGQVEGASEASCSAYNGAGGWGGGQVRLTPDPIGNRNVMILNNVLYNPAGVTAPQHFAIYGPRTPAAGANLSTPQRTDLNLRIAGNVIWNGSNGTALGIEDSEQGCQSSNSGCNEAQLLADNTINTLEPELNAPEADDLRPGEGSNLLSVIPASLLAFPGGDREGTPLAPEGVLSNFFSRDLSGAEAEGVRTVGAFIGIDSSLSAPTLGDSLTPGDPDPAAVAPRITSLRVTANSAGKRARLSVRAGVRSLQTISSVQARVTKGSRTLRTFDMRASRTVYVGRSTANARKGSRLVVTVLATNASGVTTRVRSIRVR
jgi:hypothetical protein